MKILDKILETVLGLMVAVMVLYGLNHLITYSRQWKEAK